MLKFRPARVLALLTLLALAGTATAQQRFETVSPPQPTDAEGGVEVLEFFWYGCPHCYALHPHVDAWLARKSAKVRFRLVAPPLNPSWTPHSRAFYAAEVLGVVDKFHAPFFDEIHKRKKHMRKDDDIVAFAVSLGIDGAAFRDAMYSFATETNLRRAVQLADAYGLTGVPTMTVNGKYKITASMAGGYPQMIQIVEQLLAREGGS